jgi:hypothetical protein
LFLASGEMFIAESVMIRTSGTEYCAFPCDDGLFDDTYDDLSISGFENDALVASLTLYRPSCGRAFELFPLSFFGAIDRLPQRRAKPIPRLAAMITAAHTSTSTTSI